MIRFILVKMVGERFGAPLWRATHGPTGVDLFFYACNEADAKQHIRLRYPGAVFSDEDPFERIGIAAARVVEKLK